MGFFKGLKDAWRKSCQQYISAHLGYFVTKQVFTGIFKEAWLQAVQPIKLVDAFRDAGIYPLDFSCIPERRLDPSRVYTSTHTHAVECKSSSHASKCHSASALAELELVLSKETLELYQTRHEEGYDLETDTVHNAWKKLKDAKLCKVNPVSNKVPPLDSKNGVSLASVPAVSIHLTPGQTTVSVESVLDMILVYRRKAAEEKRGKSFEMPRHLSGHQMIAILEAKERENREEDKKAKLKAGREEKLRKRQEEKENKLKEKAKKQKEREKCIAKKIPRRTGKVKADIPFEIETGREDEGVCATRGADEEGTWICCDCCSKWHHFCCVGLRPSDSYNYQSFWKCAEC